eukprot:366053-Chlamydomonas_euryale.AAC.3
MGGCQLRLRWATCRLEHEPAGVPGGAPPAGWRMSPPADTRCTTTLFILLPCTRWVCAHTGCM